MNKENNQDNLSTEEKALLESFENGEWKSVKNAEDRKASLKKVAEEYLKNHPRPEQS